MIKRNQNLKKPHKMMRKLLLLQHELKRKPIKSKYNPNRNQKRKREKISHLLKVRMKTKQRFNKDKKRNLKLYRRERRKRLKILRMNPSLMINSKVKKERRKELKRI